ncbi:hypothetical protein L873DRAFT_1786513 [Choiromyces venosus 120613-1]|uniref:Uncharacterized protein n=1 Tax=Choiromyces venosus 120613-1 TaxID=1336337 RepID=A0A3N4K767_9PEZI|nr:hypothetical protein L873DRAFT_1786513 [Choiromyces venosus 120613-1]
MSSAVGPRQLLLLLLTAQLNHIFPPSISRHHLKASSSLPRKKYFLLTKARSFLRSEAFPFPTDTGSLSPDHMLRFQGVRVRPDPLSDAKRDPSDWIPLPRQTCPVRLPTDVLID